MEVKLSVENVAQRQVLARVLLRMTTTLFICLLLHFLPKSSRKEKHADAKPSVLNIL